MNFFIITIFPNGTENRPRSAMSSEALLYADGRQEFDARQLQIIVSFRRMSGTPLYQ